MLNEQLIVFESTICQKLGGVGTVVLDKALAMLQRYGRVRMPIHVENRAYSRGEFFHADQRPEQGRFRQEGYPAGF